MKKITNIQIVNRQESFIPKGCRKPRTCIVEEEVTLSINQIEESEAPVAFILHEFNHTPVEIRTFKGKFYQYNCEYSTEWLRFDKPYSSYDYLSAESEEHQREFFARCIVIGTKVYQQCAQPFYSWHSFGVNHSWCFSVMAPGKDYQDYELRGISPDDMDALREKYEEMNHTSVRFDSFEDSIKYEYIEVLMPECCKRKFRPAIYEGNKWYDGLQKQLRNDVLKFMERKKKEYAKEFRYLSNSDFASQFKDAATSASSIMAERIA